MNATKFVATVVPDDGGTIHLEFSSRDNADAMHVVLLEKFGPQLDESWRVDEQPATWECRGEDGCEVTA